MPETMFSLAEIAKMIDASYCQVRYYILALHIKPIQKIGQTNVFSEKDATRIKAYIDRIKAERVAREAQI